MWLHNGNDEWLGACVLMSGHSGFFGSKRGNPISTVQTLSLKSPTQYRRESSLKILYTSFFLGCFVTPKMVVSKNIQFGTHSVSCMSSVCAACLLAGPDNPSPNPPCSRSPLQNYSNPTLYTDYCKDFCMSSKMRPEKRVLGKECQWPMWWFQAS